MSWYQEAIFYHIYPLGLTGAPTSNSYGEPEHRLQTLLPWIDHIQSLGCNAVYIGPLFESVGHGYETTDYKKLDTRLGTNEDLTQFVKVCHQKGIRVIFDGVFNHTGRDFFAFQDIQKNREQSRYLSWYCNVNFSGNTEYNDGFSYENWGGYNLLVKLNQRNPEVQDYICDVIRFWVKEFDVDGIRLDAADVLDFEFMRKLRNTADTVKEDFWLMGEVIHGDYSRWVNDNTLHSVTNYALHKALYSGHNDHNYFEIAHTVKYLQNMGTLSLYNFVDNHDVERIYTKLSEHAHMIPVHILFYTLPGIPSIYYGSEFGIEGRKERNSDASLRPALDLACYADAIEKNPYTALLAALAKIRKEVPALSYGSYREVYLTNRQYAFVREYQGKEAIITVNNDDQEASFNVPVKEHADYIGLLTNSRISAQNGFLPVHLSANSGDIWVPEHMDLELEYEPMILSEIAETVETAETRKIEELSVSETEASDESDPSITETDSSQNRIEADSKEDTPIVSQKTPEELEIERLQQAILDKMAANGPVTDQMRKTVYENIWHDSLVNWLNSFR